MASCSGVERIFVRRGLPGGCVCNKRECRDDTVMYTHSPTTLLFLLSSPQIVWQLFIRVNWVATFRAVTRALENHASSAGRCCVPARKIGIALQGELLEIATPSKLPRSTLPSVGSRRPVYAFES